MASDADATVSARATQAAHDAIDQIGARGAQAEQKLREAGLQMNERSQALGRDLSDYVARNPLTSIGIAAAAGFLLGSLLRR